jgi:hypothetical protein
MPLTNGPMRFSLTYLAMVSTSVNLSEPGVGGGFIELVKGEVGEIDERVTKPGGGGGMSSSMEKA